jgi:decaprenyl-phosphate phosphoribosyltransferase
MPVHAVDAPPAGRSRGTLAELVRLTRPPHWTKNLLVIPVPLVATRSWDLGALVRIAVATAAFITASALVYIGNDLADRDRDRQHPTKRHRPLASGRVSPAAALGLAAALALLFGALVAVQSPALAWPVLVYAPLGLLYSLKLKHVPLVDAFTIATGFALRVVQGYVALRQPVASWLVLGVLTGSLLLSLGRRRTELSAKLVGHRPALAGYSTYFVDQMMLLSAVLAATTTLLYLGVQAPIEAHRTAGTLLLGPVALFAIFRYLQLVLVQSRGADAVRTLLRDPPIILAALLGMIVFRLLLQVPA